jgi:hypothetical protein
MTRALTTIVFCTTPESSRGRGEMSCVTFSIAQLAATSLSQMCISLPHVDGPSRPLSASSSFAIWLIRPMDFACSQLPLPAQRFAPAAPFYPLCAPLDGCRGYTPQLLWFARQLSKQTETHTLRGCGARRLIDIVPCLQ